MDGEARRRVVHGRRHPVEHLAGHPGGDRLKRLRDWRRRGVGHHGRRRVAGLLQGHLHAGQEVVEGPLGLLHGDVAPADQGLGVELAHRAPGLDALVHQGLGERRVVALVVAVAPVADHVDHHVLVEPLAEPEGQAGHPHDGLGVVAVDVEDRRLDHLGDVGGVDRRPGLGRGGGEPQLVVDDHVDGAADAVAPQGRQVERLGHHALAGEGGVAVDEDGQHREGLGVVDEVLAGPDHALDHGVDGLEVRRVRRQLDRQADARAAHELARRPQVVLHVARALGGGGVEVALELPEDLAERLAHQVGQHVEAAPVGHAQDRLLVPGGRRRVEHLVEQGDQALGPLEAEALVAGVLGVQEALEGLGRVEPVEDVELLVGAEDGVHALDLLLDPRLLVGLLDVHVLDADAPAVGVAQDAEQVAEGHDVAAGDAVGEELPLQVPDGEPVGGGVELRDGCGAPSTTGGRGRR